MVFTWSDPRPGKVQRSPARGTVRDAKVDMIDRWDGKLTKIFQENKKICCKEANMLRKGRDRKEDRLTAVDGTMLIKKAVVEEKMDRVH